ncbi:MAG: type II secretion system protein [Ruminococcus sp.]|nr:type II secretion system protein [Ruminococcus sp.]
MKNKLKGFTLVELVVVMALMSILMLAIMKMFQPIREVYVDTTQYESQRTAQNGVIQYVTESIRFSSDMGIYTNASASAAVNAFAAQYCTDYAIDTANVSAVTTEIQKYAEVIVIDNKTSHYSKDYRGRVIRRKVDYASPAAISSDPAFSGNDANTVVTTGGWRTALGEAYYGENTYQINLIITDADSDGKSDDGMLNISVASTRNGKRDISNAGNETNVSSNHTQGGVLCRNLTASTGGVASAGIFDVSQYTVQSDTPNAVTCIVFLNKAGKDNVLAVS